MSTLSRRVESSARFVCESAVSKGKMSRAERICVDQAFKSVNLDRHVEAKVGSVALEASGVVEGAIEESGARAAGGGAVGVGLNHVGTLERIVGEIIEGPVEGVVEGSVGGFVEGSVGGVVEGPVGGVVEGSVEGPAEGFVGAVVREERREEAGEE